MNFNIYIYIFIYVKARELKINNDVNAVVTCGSRPETHKGVGLVLDCFYTKFYDHDGVMTWKRFPITGPL